MFEAVRRGAVGYAGKRFFYGWVMVAVAALGVFISGPGQSHTFSVFVGPISDDLGISSASIAAAYGAATLIAALMLPQSGRLVDRYGVRKAMLAMTALLGVGCLVFGAAANVLWLAVGFAMLRFFGQGSLMLGCANLVSQWFSKSRGLAMGLMALGFGVSMAVHPPLGQYLIDAYGWRQAWVVLGLLTWLMLLPPLAFLVFDKPEDVGLLPDGERRGHARSGAASQPPDIPGLTLSQAVRTLSFYIVATGWFAIAMLVTTLHFWQVTLMHRQGVDTEFAAWVFPISAIAMVCAMPLVGRGFDRYRTRYVFATGLMITGLSLLAVTLVANAATALAYAVLFGINNAFSMTMIGYIWPRYFGRRHLGSIQGTGQMIGVIGASLGPVPVGWAIDVFADPTATVRALAIFPILWALVVIGRLRAPASLEESRHLE